jgi:cytochrome b
VNYARTLHRRDTPHAHGHNALGAVSILVMLGLMAAVAGVGLFVVDVDGLYSGPMSSYVSFGAGRELARLHYDLFDWLLIVIGVHLLAVLFYLVWKRHNLVSPMISGRSRADMREELVAAPLRRLLPGIVLALAIVWVISTGFYF